MKTDYSQLDALRAHLRKSYPTAFSKLNVNVVNGYSLAIEWKGSDPSLKPWMLAAHQDVVSVEGQQWAEGVNPFGGLISEAPVGGVGSANESTVWGRGAIDDKNNLVAQLGAVEELLKAGFAPKRTLWMAYGHDEEIGGDDGAGHVGKFFREKGLKFSFMMDEGPMIMTGALPGLSDVAIAMVATSEKGFMNVKVTCQGAPGHSSMPAPGDTSVTVMAKAVTALNSKPQPAHFDTTSPFRQLVAGAVPLMPLFPYRFLFGA